MYRKEKRQLVTHWGKEEIREENLKKRMEESMSKKEYCYQTSVCECYEVGVCADLWVLEFPHLPLLPSYVHG